MEYHLYPPFFEITPEPSFSDAWEAFCCLLLNLRNGTTEIRRRTPPDSGVDLTWPSKKFAYQCKAVECGKAGDFPLSKAIDSLQTALRNRASIGWDKYGICTNVDVTGAQEEKIRKVYADVEFFTPSFWVPACQQFSEQVRDRFRRLVRPAPDVSVVFEGFVGVGWNAGVLHKMKFHLEGSEPGECRCRIQTGDYVTWAKWDHCRNPVHQDRSDAFDAGLVPETQRLVLHPGERYLVPIVADSDDGRLIFSGWWFGRHDGYDAGPQLTLESEVSITLIGTNLNWTRKFSVREIVHE